MNSQMNSQMNSLKLYSKCNEALLKYGKHLAYEARDVDGIIDLFITDQYKNRCVDCLIDMGEHNPRQLCGHSYCPYDPFHIDDNHYEYCDTVDKVLNEHVRLLKLTNDYVMDDEVDEQLKILR